jgi:hypothetical protein
MILRPLLSEHSPLVPSAESEPAWAIVARTQGVEAQQYLLIGQPAHARLSGELALLLRARFLPEINQDVSRAIAAHDNGWMRFPFERELHGDPPRTNTGRPQHFIEVPVEDSLAAWAESIQSAGEISRLGEYMVSAHFSRIGHARVTAMIDTPEDLERLEEFVRGEQQWQEKHESEIGFSSQQLSEYVDLLQFCDLLSLYLCCGSRQPCEFPQTFRGQQIRLRHEDGVYHTSPSIFGDAPQRFDLPVRIHPSSAGEGRTRIGFHVK